MMRNLIATGLAVLLVFTNIACVCAAPSSEPSGDHHAHHASASDQSSDCPHLDCEGNCGLESFLPIPDRDASSKFSFKVDSDDDLSAADTLSGPANTLFVLASLDPPPFSQDFRAKTPVQRKDLLLE